MSECGTCHDRRLVGGFLPAPCPSCVGNDLTRALDRIAALEALALEACDIGDGAINQIDASDEGMLSNMHSASARLAAIRAAVGGGSK
jgi:hypothetical protein